MQMRSSEWRKLLRSEWKQLVLSKSGVYDPRYSGGMRISDSPRTRALAKCDWLSGTYASDRRESQCGVRSAEFGTVLSQMRSSEFGVRNDKLEYCSGRGEAIYTKQRRILPTEALGASGREETARTKRLNYLNTNFVICGRSFSCGISPSKNSALFPWKTR